MLAICFNLDQSKTLSSGNGLTLSQTSPCFYTCAVQVLFENTVGKGEIACDKHSVFYPFGVPSTIFINLKIVVCKLSQFGRVSNLSFGKGLKDEFHYLSYI